MTTGDKRIMEVLDIIGPQYLTTKEIEIILTSFTAERAATKIKAKRKRDKHKYH